MRNVTTNTPNPNTTSQLSNPDDVEARLLQAQRADREASRLLQAERQWVRSKVPWRYCEADLRLIGPEVPAGYRSAADELLKLMREPGIIALVGNRGVGKTELACGIIREFCRDGRSARYERVMGIFTEVRSTYRRQREETEADVLNGLKRVGLLVIDEVQVRGETEWENNLLADLIDCRYADVLPTVLIANRKPAALTESLGDSIASRMQETGRVIECTWPSFRRDGRAREAKPIRHFPPVEPGAPVNVAWRFIHG